MKPTTEPGLYASTTPGANTPTEGRARLYWFHDGRDAIAVNTPGLAPFADAGLGTRLYRTTSHQEPASVGRCKCVQE